MEVALEKREWIWRSAINFMRFRKLQSESHVNLHLAATAILISALAPATSVRYNAKMQEIASGQEFVDLFDVKTVACVLIFVR